MKQEEDARREARKERDERKMEILREKELEKDREFQIKEQLRLDREAKLAREYNSWKDPSLDATYSHHQNSFNNLFLDKLGGQKVSEISIILDYLSFAGCFGSFSRGRDTTSIECLLEFSSAIYSFSKVRRSY